MLKLLLDEHISPEVARQVSRKCPGVIVLSMSQWRDASYMGVQDSIWIPEMIKDGFTLVTYDRASISPLVGQYAAQGINHNGFIFIDHKSILQKDIGSIVKALVYLWKNFGKESWLNRVEFLKK